MAQSPACLSLNWKPQQKQISFYKLFLLVKRQSYRFIATAHGSCMVFIQKRTYMLVLEPLISYLQTTITTPYRLI